MKKTIGLVAGLGMLTALAHAQGAPDPLEACYQQPDGAPRLACFNKEMQRRKAAATRTLSPPASEAKVAADTVGLQGSALRKKLKEDGVAAQGVQPIVAKVVRVVPRPHAEFAFVLDNGQTWEEVETQDSLSVRLQDTVTIKPGILGAFFLSTPRSQSVRVHRVL